MRLLCDTAVYGRDVWCEIVTWGHISKQQHSFGLWGHKGNSCGQSGHTLFTNWGSKCPFIEWLFQWTDSKNGQVEGDTFLEYIRESLVDFSMGISKAMSKLFGFVVVSLEAVYKMMSRRARLRATTMLLYQCLRPLSQSRQGFKDGPEGRNGMVADFMKWRANGW